MTASIAPIPLANRPLTIAAAGALLVLFALWAYCNSFVAPFVFDDVPLIFENPALLRFWPATSLGDRRVVGHLSFALNRRLGGLAPLGYHAVNLAIHAAAALILFGLARRTLLLPGIPSRHRRVATFLGFAIALLWLVHPLQTASVTYIIQRLESLASMFYLLVLYGLVRSATSVRPWAWYAVAIAAGWLALATKETALTAPLVALLFDRVYLSGAWRTVWRKRGLVYLAFVPPLVWLLTSLVPEAAHAGRSSVGLGVPNVTPWRYLLTQSEVITHYLKLVFIPQPLCLDYNWIPAGSFADVWPSFLFILLLVALSLACLWRWPRVGFLATAFFLLLAPTSSIVPLADAAFEHRLYLPLAAIIALLVLGARDAWGRILPLKLFRPRRPFANAAEARTAVERAHMFRRVLALALLHFTSQALLVRTLARNKEYANYVSIWRSAVEAAPRNPRARINLGGAYYVAHEPQLAKEQLQLSLTAAPSPQAYTYLGLIAQDSGETKEARRNYELALATDQKFFQAHNCLGLLEKKEKNYAAAEKQFRAAIELAPRQAPAYLHLADVERLRKRPREALTHLQRAIALWPEHPDILAELVCLHAAATDTDVIDPAAARAYAVRVELAIASTKPSVRRLEALAAAAAANGDFTAAEKIVAAAANLAAANGDTESAEILRVRVAAYAAGRTVVLP